MSAVKPFLITGMTRKTYMEQQFRVFPGDFSPLKVCRLGAT